MRENKGGSSSGPKIEKQTIRLLKLLSKVTESGCAFRENGEKLVVSIGGREHSFPKELVEAAIRERLVRKTGKGLLITVDGLRGLRDATHSQADIAQNSGQGKPNQPGASVAQPLINLDESPLKRLYTRKMPNGAKYLDDWEFEAGEKLRHDFEVAQLQPRISANLQASAGGAGKGGNFQAHEITDFAMDARKRLNRAVASLGPELSGVALDICCFLKGFETVERERSWPPRSAKLMLKTGLSHLARHYGLAGYENTRTGKLQVWQSGNARPGL